MVIFILYCFFKASLKNYFLYVAKKENDLCKIVKLDHTYYSKNFQQNEIDLFLVLQLNNFRKRE